MFRDFQLQMLYDYKQADRSSEGRTSEFPPEGTIGDHFGFQSQIYIKATFSTLENELIANPRFKARFLTPVRKSKTISKSFTDDARQRLKKRSSIDQETDPRLPLLHES